MSGREIHKAHSPERTQVNEYKGGLPRRCNLRLLRPVTPQQVISRIRERAEVPRSVLPDRLTRAARVKTLSRKQTRGLMTSWKRSPVTTSPIFPNGDTALHQSLRSGTRPRDPLDQNTGRWERAAGARTWGGGWAVPNPQCDQGGDAGGSRAGEAHAAGLGKRQDENGEGHAG